MTEAVANPRFCDQCGQSVIPLPVPHCERACADCDKTIFVVDASEGGGMKVKAGDKFVIPAGFLQVSLDTSTNGHLFRRGIS